VAQEIRLEGSEAGDCRITVSTDGVGPAAWETERMALVSERDAQQATIDRLEKRLRAAENRLAEQRARLAAAFTHAPVGYWWLDPDGTVVEVNAALAGMMGCDAEALSGRSVFDFLAPSDRSRIRECLESAFSGATQTATVFAALHPPSGQAPFHAWFSWRAGTDRGGLEEDASLRGLLLVAVHDAGLGERFEKSLVEAKEEWERTFHAVMDPMALIDDRHRVVRVNRALADRLGLAPKDCLGKCCFELIHGLEGPPEECPFGNWDENGETFVRVERYEPVLGGYFITTITPFANPGSDRTWSVHVFHDITRRKEVEESLRISEGRFRAITENSADITAILVDGAFHYVSPAVGQVLGLEPGEMLTRRPDAFMHPEDWPAHREALERAAAHPGESQVMPDARFRHRRGEWVSLESKATYLPDLAGVNGMVVVYRDITEKKQMAFQLQQSIKLESIGRLAGGVAHEFNNILGIIIGNAELAVDDLPEGSNGRAFVEEILGAGTRAKEVVRQLIQFSRRTPTERRPFSLAPLITETLRMMRGAIPPGIEIKSRIPVPHESISGDPARIRQLLVHLCTNAFEAMDKRGGRLDISLENVILENTAVRFPDLAAGRYVLLTVADNGHGIEPEAIGRIFDPYFSTRNPSKQSGMGLAIAHGIVRSHEGAITVESQPGKGSRFRVFLPVYRSRPSEAPPPAGVALLGEGERILVVEDEPVLLKTLTHILERLGYQVDAFDDPVAAYRRFADEPDRYHLLLTDLTMPGMDGQALVEKSLSVREDLPVILCSGDMERADLRKLSRMKTVQTLSKPLDSRTLSKALKRATGR
jgi:PAS domain S-box-containing protein